MPAKSLQVAVCLPARNEWASLQALIPEIAALKEKWELVDLHVIVFDDGSSDGTSTHLRDYATADFHLSVLRSPSPRGKTLALAAGFRYALEAGAEYIFMMDADGQDDPRYLSEMLEKLISGAELVNGRRSNRKHSLIKRQSSRMFNGLVRAMTGLSVLDLNSGLKGFRRGAAEYLSSFLYGELHRVLLVIAFQAGFRIDEVRVVNRARTAGTTKYGAGRGWRGILDLFAWQALARYQTRPGHLFSGLGLVFFFGGFLSLLGGIIALPSVSDPLLAWIAVVLICFGIGVLLVGLGFIAELVLFLSKAPELNYRVVIEQRGTKD